MSKLTSIAVKNINCDFDFLKERIDKVWKTYKIEKDTFIFEEDEGICAQLYEHFYGLKKLLAIGGKEILVNKGL